MRQIKYFPEQIRITQLLLRWTLLIAPVSITVGLFVAFFLWLLDLATIMRWQHLWLIYLLPLAGVFIVWVYNAFGKDAERGNNLIMDEIHAPGGGVPARMTPLIFITTILTHLFGGSAGREGTAVQMGGSIASQFAKWFRLHNEDKRIILTCGMSAGFGAVFGTPVAGAVFAMEVLAVGRIKYDALMPSLIAGLLADITCASCGIHHTQYHIAFADNAVSFLPHISFNVLLLGKVIIAGVLFGLASFAFAELSHGIKKATNRLLSLKWLIPIVGGVLVIVISYLLGTPDYLGLGVTTPTPGGVSIVNAFNAGGATNFSWFWKLLLTAITLGTGFKGGEVTPLFFIGATLGNMLAIHSGAPVDLFAALGFIAVFAGATNTPLACIFMGIELFGSENVIYYAVACLTAYYFSGHTGIYHSQRVAVSKFHNTHYAEELLGTVKDKWKHDGHN